MNKMINQVWCSDCEKDVEPDMVGRSCMAMYGSVVYAKGYCPNCGKVVVAEHMVDDEGLHPPKRS